MPAEHPVRRESYYVPILGMDLTSYLLLAAGLEYEPSAVIGAVGLTLGSPIIHLSKGQPRQALTSLGLRVGLPILASVSIYMLSAYTWCEDVDISIPLCSLEYGFGAGVLALGTATALDYLYLAKRTLPSSSQDAGARVLGRPSWSPAVTLRPEGGAALSVVGMW